MKRRTAIELLGGITGAAHWLGVTPHAISNWQVDADDNLVGRRVCDSVLAGLTRKLHADGVLATEPEFADLFELP